MNLEELKKIAEEYGYALHALRSTVGDDSMSVGKREVINSVIDDLDVKIHQRPILSNLNVDNEKKQKFQDQYKNAFLKYLRKGINTDLISLLNSSNNGSSFDSTGFALTSAMNTIISNTMSASPFRQLARIVNVSRDSLDVAAYVNDIAAEWGDERSVAAETDAFNRKTIKVNELTAQPKITQKMIDDDAVDHESWIAELLGDIFLSKEDNAFLYGDGKNKPVGIFSYPEGKDTKSIETIKCSDVTFESLLNLQSLLDSKYEHSGETAFVTSKSVLAKIRSIKDGSGRYIWTPGAVYGGKYDYVYGSPILSTSGAGNEENFVLYGNFRKGYQIVDRSDIKIQRDPYSSKPFVVFYATKRTGGDVIDTRAIKVLSIKGE